MRYLLPARLGGPGGLWNLQGLGSLRSSVATEGLRTLANASNITSRRSFAVQNTSQRATGSLASPRGIFLKSRTSSRTLVSLVFEGAIGAINFKGSANCKSRGVHQLVGVSRRSQSEAFNGLLGIIGATAALGLAIAATAFNESLKPDPDGDTFEMGLYTASQKELARIQHEKRQRALDGCRNRASRWFVRGWFAFKDAVLEPLLIASRFVQLALIFVPVFLLYPITFFGHRVHLDGTTTHVQTTHGARLWYAILRRALEVAGPSFIKLGQWAGSRTDIFSEGLCMELGNLHSHAKKHSLKFTEREVCRALKINHLNDAFEKFDERPLGVGAIAQVYVGQLSHAFVRERELQLDPDENRWCAIKIIHPHAARNISRDLRIMQFFADAIDMIPTMEWLSLPNEVEQFAILMRLQLDLRIECMNLKRFNDNFKRSFQVKFPRGFQELTTRQVLFEEYIYGFPMEEFLRAKDELNDTSLRKKVSHPFIDAFLQMLILDDFIHADLHPGNVMIRFVKADKYHSKSISTEEECYEVIHRLKRKLKNKDESFLPELRQVLTDFTPQICFIDTGLVTELNTRNRTNFIALFDALARFDGYRAGELMIERSRTPETAIDKELFALKVEKLVAKVKKRTFTLGTVSIGDLLDQMLSMVRGHHVRMEGDFVSVVVAILLLEGIGRQLDPDLDLFASSLPILREFGMKREGRSILQDVDTLSMWKIWLGLELRQFMNLSVKQTDQLCPNY
ncbi:Cqd1p [Lachancea thermotolerans CBS 6340]|uniref:KLTH0E13860p n=1 Tax=Lachancea thermotolerans (strain ATCC 56472 / CBS 6340 / NRRL Y-8284) TaxID=559295 RepID=C5DIN3_LACTC|nr:KLTH0E13860p [Lachancea thermotolerans CBS 6340]CAR23644.1 KLTH0E13860p [Lachancea thermotolerans CBS 6340]